MTTHNNEEVTVLEISMHDVLIGYLAGFNNGRNVLSIADSFRNDPNRPTFSLITHPAFPNASKLMAEPWARNQRLHPILANLLPEGSLREFIAQNLKIHINNEFHILSYLGEDLPGAIKAIPLHPEEVPTDLLDRTLSSHGKVKAVKFDKVTKEKKFSLAGVQMKFSMLEMGGRYNLSKGDALGDWIIKTPSAKHKFLPLNEYTAMSLAELVGIEIPEIKLVELNKLNNLPPINLPSEKLAFAIKRFDRTNVEHLPNQRIHMEDFAQILVKYPHEKYTSASYENIGKVIYNFSGDGLADTQQFAKRLLVNILLANGDAHLKNWSLLYSDTITPRISPAYDIVTTNVYMTNETQYALNLGKTKEWYTVTMAHFQSWAKKSGIPWRAIKPHLNDTISKARELWPEALKTLPMDEAQKVGLKKHWSKLQDDFKISAFK